MKLVEVVLENFRGYGARTVLKVEDLTVLVGKNDAGKSTFLEALTIALADGKIDASDIHVHAPMGADIVIECAFDDLPAKLTLDATSSTSLTEEYLVDAGGRLRLRWLYSITGEANERKLGKQRVKVIARHPTGEGVDDLHSKKNADLKILVVDASVAADCELNNNASMRKALWAQASENGRLEFDTLELELAKEDGKSILGQIQAALPMYVLFRADRPSTDQDAEVQDPMKVAVRTALEELRTEVDAMKQRVRAKALEVATRTLGSLREFDVPLADSLTPEFADPKLDSAFKLSLLGDDGIAVNKRGSGVRRLVLFSFFRAEAERRHGETEGRGIIYAVEEPETALHPDFQRKVVISLQRVAETAGCQVLLTTHSPGLAGLLPAATLRLVGMSEHGRSILVGDEALDVAVKTLGVVPDHRVRVLVCVEGPYDRAFMQAACTAYRAAGGDLVCLTNDPAVAFVLLGGSTLTEWVNHHLLRNIRIPEFHVYDRDVSKYADAVAEVNQRGCGHSARQTNKRELENYLHPDAIWRVLAGPAGNLAAVVYGSDDDVESVIAAAMPDHNGNPRKKLARRTLKHWLNHDVAAAMTASEFDAQDPAGEIKSWLAEITRVARGT
jgi:putative ATP-dependent endonuclease of OLD family